jgi:hypothetical protein
MGYSSLPSYRHDIIGNQEHPLNIQFAGEPVQLTSLLQGQGWDQGEVLDWGNVLRLLSPRSTIDSLPVLPQVHDARHEALVMTKSMPGDQRLVLRLWSTPFLLDPEGLKIYVGNVTLQGSESLIGLLAIPRTLNQFQRPLDILRQTIKALEEKIVADTPAPDLIRLRLESGQHNKGISTRP